MINSSLLPIQSSIRARVFRPASLLIRPLSTATRSALQTSVTSRYPPSSRQPKTQSIQQFQSVYHRKMSTSTFPPPSIQPLINDLATHLKDNSQTLALAETATGGLVSSSLLSVPGASKIYRGGLTLYTLESRINYAGWTQENISNYKGPTTEIVSGLGKKVRGDLDATWVLAESGTAGPTGGNTRNRTPGYVALAVVGENGVWTKEVETGSQDRVENMLRFAEEGIKFLIQVVKGEIKPDAEGQGEKL